MFRCWIQLCIYSGNQWKKKANEDELYSCISLTTVWCWTHPSHRIYLAHSTKNVCEARRNKKNQRKKPANEIMTNASILINKLNSMLDGWKKKFSRLRFSDLEKSFSSKLIFICLPLPPLVFPFLVSVIGIFSFDLCWNSQRISIFKRHFYTFSLVIKLISDSKVHFFVTSFVLVFISEYVPSGNMANIGKRRANIRILLKLNISLQYITLNVFRFISTKNQNTNTCL